MELAPISKYIEDQFPSFYQENGPEFILFVKAYYEWMEEQGNIQYHTSNIETYFNIDKTIDEFIEYFREQYLPNITFTDVKDKRRALKHAREFVSSKGSVESIRLLMKMVYNQDASVYKPSENILRASDGVWYEPKYIELNATPKAQSFIGKTVYGSQSGASAIVERIARKNIKGSIIDVAYLSSIGGKFVTGDIITSDGILDGCPKVVGSLTTIDLVSGGKDFNAGDVVAVNSSLTGKGGQARVSSVGVATGRVTFDLKDGGYGFSSNAIVLVSDRVLNISNKTPDPSANASYTDFIAIENVVEPMTTIECLNASNTFVVGDQVFGYDALKQVESMGYVVGIPSPFNANNITIKVINYNGTFSNSATIGTLSNTINALVASVTDSSATATMVGTSNTGVGVANISGAFTANSNYAYVYGATSNTYANISSVSQGSGATFAVGSLSDTETVFLNADRLAGNNVNHIPYMGIKLNNTFAFPKSVTANINTILNDALTRENLTIGSVASLTNINLGSGYNQDPYVLVVEPLIAGFGRQDYVIEIDDASSTFLVGESIEQNFSNSHVVINYNNKNKFLFEEGEVISQGSVWGSIKQIITSSSTVGSLILDEVSGTFVPGLAISGVTSGATATVDNIGNTVEYSASRGVISAVNGNYLTVKRKSFNNVFTPNIAITGSTSGATANVLNVADATESLPIGLNADISASAGTVAGFIQAVEVFDSGFAYKDYELVELKSEENDFVASGYVRLVNHGQGEGYYTSERGFLNEQRNFLHDNDYYQEYSYEVQTGVPLSLYGDMLKQVCHVAGTKLFGSIQHSTVVDTTTEMATTPSIQDTFELTLESGDGHYLINEIIKSNNQTIGTTTTPVYFSGFANGFIDIIRGTDIVSPSSNNVQKQQFVLSGTYDGSQTFIKATYSNTSDIILSGDTVSWLSNTFIANTTQTYFDLSSVVVSMTANQMSQGISAKNFKTTRNSTAVETYANGMLRTVGSQQIRLTYGNGLFLEPESTNLLPYSKDFAAHWSATASVVAAGDINSLFGIQDASKLIGQSTTAVHEIFSSATNFVAGQTYALSVYARPLEMTNIALMLPSTRFGTNQQVIFNLRSHTGLVTNGTPTYTIEPLANGWVRVGINAVATSSGTAESHIRLATASSTTFTGDGASGLHIHGAQLELNRTSSYIPTKGATATRDADEFYFSDDGWWADVAAGFVTSNSDKHIIKPLLKINFEYNYNYEQPFNNSNVIQTVANTIVASGSVLWANNTCVVITDHNGVFGKHNGNIYAQNTQMITTAGSVDTFVVGETISQTIGNTVVTGVVKTIMPSTKSIILSNTSGTFNTQHNIVGSISNTAVYITHVEPVCSKISSLAWMNNFSDDTLTGIYTTTISDIDVVHNSEAKYEWKNTTYDSAINKINITGSLTGLELIGQTITGTTTNSTAVVAAVRRL